MTLDFLHSKRSFRKFEKGYEIPKETLNDVINTTLKSPTGADCQEIDLICVTNRDLMTKLNQAAIDGLGNPIIVQKILDTQKMGGYENITCYDCSALVFMVKDKERNTHPELTNLDAGIAAGMLMSAIAAYGLNSIPLGIFTNPKVDEVLGLESRSVLMAVAIGKAEGPIPPKVIKNNAKFIE